MSDSPHFYITPFAEEATIDSASLCRAYVFLLDDLLRMESEGDIVCLCKTGLGHVFAVLNPLVSVVRRHL